MLIEGPEPQTRRALQTALASPQINMDRPGPGPGGAGEVGGEPESEPEIQQTGAGIWGPHRMVQVQQPAQRLRTNDLSIRLCGLAPRRQIPVQSTVCPNGRNILQSLKMRV